MYLKNIEVISLKTDKKYDFFGDAFAKAAKNKEPMSIDKRKAVHKFVKSYEFVKWKSEEGKNTCAVCRERNGRLYKYGELNGIWPAHKNCHCKLVPAPAVEAGTATINGLSGIENKYIMGSEGYRKYVLKNGEVYHTNGILPEKKGRTYYSININNKKNNFVIVSNDGMCFVTYDGFKNIYPVENKNIVQKEKKEREAIFFDSFKNEMDLFENDKMAPMAYTYIMQNTYNWYLSDNTSDRAMIEAKLSEFKKTGYKKTGIKFYDEGIEFMPKKPSIIFINQEEHYFRNKLNINYEWKDFEKLNDSLPDKYKWQRMMPPLDAMHQNTAKEGKPNRKYVSFDGHFEAVYSYYNVLLNEKNASIDMGTYNYAPSITFKGNPFKTAAAKDMSTYNLYKNTKEDLKKEMKKQENLFNQVIY